MEKQDTTNNFPPEVQLTCTKCRSTLFSAETKGHNLVATCTRCGAFIKNIPYQEPTLYFGKYKGERIKNIEDIDYLTWVLRKVKLTSSTRYAIGKQLDNLHDLAR